MERRNRHPAHDGKLSPNGDINVLQRAVLLAEVDDFIRPSTPQAAVQKVLLAIVAALGRMLGYTARYEKYALPTE